MSIEIVEGATVITGEHIGIYALLVLKHGLLFEQKTGMRMSRGRSSLQIVKQRMGLAPRKRLRYDDAIAWVDAQLPTSARD